MRRITILAVLATIGSPALADDRALITAQMQELSDALVPGNLAPWNNYVDANVIYAEEDDSYKGKAGMLKEIVPLPKGSGATIKVELLSFYEDGDVAIALFRQNEIENYFGQNLYAKYLTNTTWKKRADGWKMIAGQVLAERTDPPGLTLPADQLAQYVGTYRLKNSDANYRLTLSRGVLIGTRDRRKPATWNAEASDVFFITGDPRIRKIFQRDALGKITGFNERRESWDVVWVKIA